MQQGLLRFTPSSGQCSCSGHRPIRVDYLTGPVETDRNFQVRGLNSRRGKVLDVLLPLPLLPLLRGGWSCAGDSAIPVHI